MRKLSDVQVGYVKRHLKYVLDFVSCPAPPDPEESRQWCRGVCGVDTVVEVGKCWAELVEQLGCIIFDIGLAERTRLGRPPLRCLVLADMDTTADYARTVLCIAVDHAEGEAIHRRARAAAKIGKPLGEEERTRAAELIVDAWQIRDVLIAMLHTDMETLQRFRGDLRACVEGWLSSALTAAPAPVKSFGTEHDSPPPSNDPLGAILNDPKAAERRLREGRLKSLANGWRQRIDALKVAWGQRYPQAADVPAGEDHFAVWATRLKRWGDAVHACGWRARNALRDWQPPSELPADCLGRRAALFTHFIAARAADPTVSAAEIEDGLRRTCTEENAELLSSLFMPGHWLKRIQSAIEAAVLRHEQQVTQALQGPPKPLAEDTKVAISPADPFDERKAAEDPSTMARKGDSTNVLKESSDDKGAPCGPYNAFTGERVGNRDETYYSLACRLLGQELSEAPLPLPSHDPSNLNPGDLMDADDQRIAAAVCGAGIGMTADVWARISEQQRIPWLQRAVTRQETQAMQGPLPVAETSPAPVCPARSSVAEAKGDSPELSVEAQMPRIPSAPIKYLMSWREILDALDQKNNTENRRRVRDMNKQFEGPISLPSKGGQPKVSKEMLLSWWNGLEKRFRESEQKQADTQACLQARHEFGRDGTVLPDISGHVQNRRGKKSDQ